MEALLRRSLESGRVHSAYLITGPGEPARAEALTFVRALVCRAPSPEPCEVCTECHRSSPGEPIALDGTGRKGPLYRHVGNHEGLLWVERGAEDTRVRIGQVRELQAALRLRGEPDARRAAVLADAEWLNQEAQNALLRLLEEPPPRTTLVLVAASSSALLATVRSRCQRVALPPGTQASEPPDPRFDGLERARIADLLDWAEACRGARAPAAAEADRLLAAGATWLRQRVRARVEEGRDDVRPELGAFRVLLDCRKALAQRNANPQMVAERAWFALHRVSAR